MGAVVNEEAFCLKWNDFHASLTSTFTELRAESDLLDATIFCEGQLVRAHKLVLSASSKIFRQLFRNNGQNLLQASIFLNKTSEFDNVNKQLTSIV